VQSRDAMLCGPSSATWKSMHSLSYVMMKVHSDELDAAFQLKLRVLFVC
jgi:hypothetical protein